MKKLMMIVAVIFGTAPVFAQGALGDVVGEIQDLKTGESVYGAEVFIESLGTKYRTRTDFEGRFRMSGVTAGTHMLNVVYKGDTMPNIEVNVPMDGFGDVGLLQFTSNILDLLAVNASAKDQGLKLEYGSLPVKEITAEDIANSSAKNDIKGLITSISTDVRMTSDGELVFRGARKGDMLYLMDGVKTASIGTVPSSSIARMKVYSGGLPAKYGDTLGGVVVMETKSYFDLYNKWLSQEIKAGRQ